jgi:hypothetical protein
VGYSYDANDFASTLVEHWDGTSWSVVPSPTSPFPYGGYLFSVSAAAPNVAWAVGDAQQADFMIQWDGTAWQTVAAPVGWTFSAIWAESPTDAWVVGEQATQPSTLIEHWDGVQWGVVPSPYQPGGDIFKAVWAASSTTAWAVGFYETVGGKDLQLIEHLC